MGSCSIDDDAYLESTHANKDIKIIAKDIDNELSFEIETRSLTKTLPSGVNERPRRIRKPKSFGNDFCQ